MRTWIYRALAVLTAALTIGAVAATPASAAKSDCPGAGYYCVWTGWSHAGVPAYYWDIPTSGTGGYCVNYGGSLNDNVDSNYITGTDALSVTQYRDANCSGTAVSFNRPSYYGGPNAGACQHSGFEAWACFSDGWGSYLPSSAWIIKS
jgi:hypothetical protein